MVFRTIDLAHAIGVSPQAVRDYEDRDMIPPVERHSNGYRLYTERHLDALRSVRALIVAGYDKDQIRELMNATHNGSLDVALAIIDARHAMLNERRQQADQVLQTIKALMSGRDGSDGSSSARNLHIGAAAKTIGIPTSTLRFWEKEGLLHPTRDTSNRYRMYDGFQIQRLKVIILLRRGDYSFDAIRSVVDDMTIDNPGSSFQALEKQRNEIFEASRACTAATAAFWNYIDAGDFSDPIALDPSD